VRKTLIIFSLTLCLVLVSLANKAETLRSYGPTTAKDQLWYIAKATRPSTEVSKQQTMLAILNANPKAFRDNNVNGLRAGYQLKIPSLAQIKAIPALTALNEISAQNAAWRNPIELKTNQDQNIDSLEILGLGSELQPLAFTTEYAPLSLEPESFITPATTETLTNTEMATYLRQLSQQWDNFLLNINQLNSQAQQKLDQVISEQQAMKNQIISLNTQLQQLRQNSVNHSAQGPQFLAFNHYAVWILGSSVMICLMILLYTALRNSQVSRGIKNHKSDKSQPARHSPNFNETIESIETIDDEYDYLGSQEGLAAKLDLARAYIDMGDTAQAGHVLEEVMQQGTEDQRHLAKKLLSELCTDTVH
jgi:FimV-like protein